MKKIIILAILFLVVIVCKTPYKSKKKNNSTIIYNTDSTTVKFKGAITNIKYNCRVDGLCSIEVNNKWLIEIAYGKRDPKTIPKERGKVTGIRFFPEDEEIIGKKVTVFAKIKTKNRLTVEGNNNYYVKVIEPLKPKK